MTKQDDKHTKVTSLSGKSVENRQNAHAGKSKQYTHIDNASFLALLIRSFVSFSLIIILGVVAIFALASWATSSNGIALRRKEIYDYSSELASGNYHKIPAQKVFGEEGYLEIVRAEGSASGELVYSSREQGKEGAYTVGELDCIQHYASGESVIVHNFKDETGKPNYYLIIFSSTLDDGSTQERNYLLKYLGENNYSIESQSSVATQKTRFTDKEFYYLTYNASNEERVLTRYSFKGNDGNNYYAIILDCNQKNTSVAWVVAVIIAGCIIALFIAVMVLYIRYINKHVQKPLAVLSYAMTSFAKGDHGHVSYKGSKEFEHLYDSFNEMVDILDASEEQKRALEDDKQRMLAGLSHDLKTPITIIQGFTGAIKDGIVGEDDKQKYLQVIYSKATQMTELVNQLYEYNKLEHPDFAIDKKRKDIAEIARIFLASIYNEFELRGYVLDTQIPDECIYADVDEGQIKRVFENITTNFFKYTPKGCTMLFSMTVRGESVCVSIADNGNGIDDDAKEHLFDAFVVGEKSRNKQGSGLGLAVCKRIVNMHGGDICLSNNPIDGYAMQFDVTLPLSR